MSFKLGMNGKLSYIADGFTADAGNNNLPDLTSGVGTVIGVVKDATMGGEKAVADVSTRGNNGFRAQVGTLKDGSIEMQVQWDPTVVAFDELLETWYNESKIIGLAILDETYVAESVQYTHDGDGTGLIGNFSINDFTRDEGLEDAMVANVTANLTFSDVVPGYLKRGGLLPLPT